MRGKPFQTSSYLGQDDRIQRIVSREVGEVQRGKVCEGNERLHFRFCEAVEVEIEGGEGGEGGEEEGIVRPSPESDFGEVCKREDVLEVERVVEALEGGDGEGMEEGVGDRKGCHVFVVAAHAEVSKVGEDGEALEEFKRGTIAI
jgi:hypothetical protein